MIKILTNGRYGDALTAIARIKSTKELNDNLEDIEVTHAIINKRKFTLKDFETINHFYNSQNIKSKPFFFEPSKTHERKRLIRLYEKWKYDYLIMYPHSKRQWFSKPDKNTGENIYYHKDYQTYRYNAHIPLNYNKIKGVDVVIQPVSGSTWAKSLGLHNIREMVLNNPDRHFSFVGGGEDFKEFQEWGVSYIKKTFKCPFLEGFVDVICSCNEYIGLDGFGHFLANMQGKIVHIVNKQYQAGAYEHPKWNTHIVESINDIILNEGDNS